MEDYNPFNLISISPGQAQFLTNRPIPSHTRLPPGIYGLANGALNEPWPKTVALKAAMAQWLGQDAVHPELLLNALAQETRPSIAPSTDARHNAREQARQSAIFIHNPVYGTRCSTVVAIDKAGRGDMIERRFDAAGMVTGQTRISFRWPN